MDNIDRSEMSFEEEERFVNNLFDEFEKEGFPKLFWTPYSDLSEYIDTPVKVVGRATTKDFDLECLPAWKVQFHDGNTGFAYPEEIISSEIMSVKSL